jgi:hyperosmotically inducible periplasmic protein
MTSVRFQFLSFRVLSGAVLGAVLLAPVLSQGQEQSPAKPSPDNSATNQTQTKTAEQLIADKSLSVYGHNVKIITKDGSVTLKGPVNSEEEKQTIASKAQSIVGSPDKVTNQLLVKQ